MQKNDPNIDDLILFLLRENNPEALRLLHLHHHQPLLRYFQTIIKHHEDVEDLLHDLFLAIWTKRHSLNFTKPLRYYLLAVAHNKALNHIRNSSASSATNTLTFDKSPTHNNIPSPSDSLQNKEIESLYNQTLELLSEKLRLTFLLSREQNLTYKQIAAIMQVSEKAVEKNISKVLSILRKSLRDYLKLILLFISS